MSLTDRYPFGDRQRMSGCTARRSPARGVTLDDVLRLHALGLSVIPLKPNSKAPDGEWKPYQTSRPSEGQLREWFANGVVGNAGIPLGAVSGVVVIETDTPEAEGWCAAHLPDTPMKTRSARGIHRYYRLPTGGVELPASLEVGDLTIEVKRDGQYVVAPGSVHPSGHVYTEVEPWPTSLDRVPAFPMDGLGAEPQKKLAPLPKSVTAGNRNKTLFREGCRLRRLGLERDEILAALLSINTNRCHPPLDTREVETIAASCAKYQPTDLVVLNDVERLNERFAIVSVSNKVVVMETWPDGGIKALWPFGEFRNLLIKERVKTNGKERSLADVWLHHPHGRRYDRLVYVMPGSTERCGPDDYNGWLGFTVKPVAGDWSQNRKHLFQIICSGVQAYYDWVFNWIAALVQWPGRHTMTAIVLRGIQGGGKGHFVHLMLGQLFHKQQYLHIIGAEALTGRFNEHLSGKVLIFADESTWGGDPRAAERLKGMVTESTVNIERKFLPLVEEPSALHIIVASNNEWPVAIPPDDRRFMVLDVADSKRQNDEYFRVLIDELRNGGRAAMLHDLLAYEVDESALRHPLSTPGKRDVTIHSCKPIERWWFERLKAGWLVHTQSADGKGNASHGFPWPDRILKAEVHNNYLEFLDKHYRDGRARRATETELGTFLQKYATQQRSMVEGKRQVFWNIPPIDVCRAMWVKAFDWPRDYVWDEAE